MMQALSRRKRDESDARRFGDALAMSVRCRRCQGAIVMNLAQRFDDAFAMRVADDVKMQT